MPLIIKLMEAHSPCRPIFINANRIRAIFEESRGTNIYFDIDSKFTVKESPEKVVQLIQEAVAAFGSQESPTPSPSSVWHFPMPISELSTSEADMPLPSEGCVCGIRPHFESDSLP